MTFKGTYEEFHQIEAETTENEIIKMFYKFSENWINTEALKMN